MWATLTMHIWLHIESPIEIRKQSLLVRLATCNTLDANYNLVVLNYDTTATGCRDNNFMMGARLV